LNLAFHINVSGAAWTGGAHYLQNLLAALRALPSASPLELRTGQSPSLQEAGLPPESVPLEGRPPWRPSVVLVLNPGQAEAPPALAPLVDRALALPPPDRERWPGFWERQSVRLRKRLGVWRAPPLVEPPISRALRAAGVQALFSNTEYGPAMQVPLAAWIPDFQHHHLPDMFPAEERQNLDAYRTAMAKHAQRIVLSSEAARQDFARFAPGAVDKARVVRFVAQVPGAAYDRNPAWVCRHYGLPERFVHLPNQFWKHKNHAVVAQALALLRERHPEVVVVCTGNTNDHRDPAHFGRLLEQVSAQGVRDRFVVLGLVPAEHLWALMRQSLALLQPSLFEGWSTTVEEAKSLGKAVVLSDLPVHREQAPAGARYFDPRSPESLAEALVAVFATRTPGPDAALEQAARTALPGRTLEFARTLVRVMEETSGGH